MFNNRNNRDKKQYAVLSSNLMKLIGELCGYELNEQICNLLAEDATFRLNELLNQSENLRRRSNKERLDVDDVNLMLKCYNCKPIDGHSSSDKNRIRSLIDDKDEPIDLLSETNKLLNDKQSLVIRSVDLSSEFVKLKYSDLERSIDETDLDCELKKYFYFLIKHLFTSNSKLSERISKDLSTNDQLGDLVGYLINHLTSNLHSILDDQSHSMRMIHLLECLIKNPNVEFKLQNSLVQLIDLSLDCLLHDSKFKHLDYLYKFKYLSAKLLKSLIYKHYQVLNHNRLLIKILNLLLNQFVNNSQLAIKYAIIIFFQNLNPFIFFDILFPALMKFVENLEIKKSKNLINAEEIQLFDTILLTLVTCFNYVINSDKIRNSTEYDIKEYYSKIYQFYGDSFNNQITCNDANFIKINFIDTSNQE